MRRITTALLLGAAAAVALAPLLACEDDTTVNTAFKDGGTEAAAEGGEGGSGEGGAEGGKEGGADAADAASDADDGGG